MAYLLYVAVKLISYIAWCWLALRLWRVHGTSFVKAAGFGVLRLAIGIVFGVAIFLAIPIQAEDLLRKYIVIYVPVRIVEWFILARIIGRNSEIQTILKTATWCLGGIVVSFVADFASSEGIAGHFCVGRCLC